jgi:hypothetical protein
MKKSNVKWTSMIVAVMMFAFVTGCNSSQQEQNAAEETEEMGMADGMNGMNGMDMAQQENGVTAVNTAGEPAFVVAYMDIKNALVNDNYEQVKQAASQFQKSLADSKLSEEQRNQLKNNAAQLADAQDIEAQRQAFAQLSQQLYQTVKNQDVTDKPLYWQHCPMAMNNQGANWLSYEEQVRNPFMGQRMPGCGSVEETL